jgi:transcription antitermination factor NusG
MILPYDADKCFSVNDPDRIWWVAHTKPRHEKKFAEDCVEKEIAVFLPIQEQRKRKRGRTWVSDLPLFPGYAFLRCSVKERDQAFRTGHVVRVLEVLDQDGFEGDVYRLKKALEIAVPLEPYRFAKIGTWVRVKEGPMKGLEGEIVKDKRGYRFVINVRMIKKAVAVDIDAEMLEPA